METEERDRLEGQARWLSDHLADELERLDHEQLLAVLPAIATYRKTLESVIAEAPLLARRFNRLPRTFPTRQSTKFRYEYFDIYSPSTTAMRDEIHGWIRQIDGEANLISARTRYDDQTMEPCLAEAELTVERAPLRLQVQGQHTATANQDGLPVIGARAYALFVKTRPSTPELRLELQGLDHRLLKWLRLWNEPEIGHAVFDDMYFIHGTEEDARRLLRPEVHEPLLSLAEGCHQVELTVGDGLARLEWVDRGRSKEGLGWGVKTLVAVRNTPPVRLLRKPRQQTAR
jgi:hypothetical protein